MGLEHVPDIKALVEAGDINLASERARFKTIMGRDMKLSDEGLIQALAMTDDDDDSLFIENVLHIEDQVDAPAK